MKLLKGLLALVLVMTLATTFAQIDVDLDEGNRTNPVAGETKTVDKVNLNVVVECVRLIDAFTTGANNITLGTTELTNAGGLWTAAGDNTLTFNFDYTTNCTSVTDATGPVAGTQKITLEMASLPSGLSAAIGAGAPSTTDNSTMGGALGMAGAVVPVAAAATAYPIVTDIQNVSAVNGTVAIGLSGFAEVTPTAGTDVVLTFTLTD